MEELTAVEQARVMRARLHEQHAHRGGVAAGRPGKKGLLPLPDLGHNGRQSRDVDGAAPSPSAADVSGRVECMHDFFFLLHVEEPRSVCLKGLSYKLSGFFAIVARLHD